MLKKSRTSKGVLLPGAPDRASIFLILQRKCDSSVTLFVMLAFIYEFFRESY
jgi:hypothetical protein